MNSSPDFSRIRKKPAANIKRASLQVQSGMEYTNDLNVLTRISNASPKAELPFNHSTRASYDLNARKDNRYDKLLGKYKALLSVHSQMQEHYESIAMKLRNQIRSVAESKSVIDKDCQTDDPLLESSISALIHNVQNMKAMLNL